MAAPNNTTASPMLKPALLAETGRRSSSSNRMSHGRGGAGNIGAPSAAKKPVDSADFETPTLKSEMYTTGRGGSGNMAKNDDPEEARRAQDVVAKPRRESTSSAHVGRGGAANVFKPSAEEIEKAKRENAKWESAIGDDETADKKDTRGLAQKGKDSILGLLGKK